MKRIGLLSLAIVLALGTLGVGYAAWYQTVEIEQTVQTGELEAGVFAVLDFDQTKPVITAASSISGFVFTKDIDADQIPAGSLIAEGTYSFYEAAAISIGNYHPSIWVREDFVLGVRGSVPVKLQVTPTVIDPDGVYNHMTVSWRVYHNAVEKASGIGLAVDEFPEIVDALEGMQVYGCDVLVLWLDKYLEQSAPQDAGPATFTLTVTAVQYNKYPYPIPTP